MVIVLKKWKTKEALLSENWVCLSVVSSQDWEKDPLFTASGASGKEPVCQCKRLRDSSIHGLGRSIHGLEDPLRKLTATHSSSLAWRMTWMEEPSGLQSMGSQRVGTRLKGLSTHTHKENTKDLFQCSVS